MSTISLPGERQIRHFFPFEAVASETTVATFIATASDGEIQMFNEDGTATVTGDFYFLKKNLNTGKLEKSDLITPADITYEKLTPPRNKTGKTQVFTLSTVVVGAVYNMTLKLNYATSEQNFMVFHASTKAITGDTVTTVMTRLAKQLGDNLAASIHTSTTISGTDTIIAGTTVLKNKYFTLSQVLGVLTITEKDWILDGYVTGLKTMDQIMWNAEIASSNETAMAGIAKTATAPVFANGQGYQMKELERYLVGHRQEVDNYDVTLGFNRPSEITLASDYYVYDISYFDLPRDNPHRSKKQLTLVSTDQSDIEAIQDAVQALMA